MTYKQHDRVIIHSLGPSYEGQEFKGRIVGLAVDYDGRAPASIWIIELDNPEEMNWSFSCVTMPGACLKADEDFNGTYKYVGN